jgi:hypothetical protein
MIKLVLDSGQTVFMPNVVIQSSYSSASRRYTAFMRHFIRDKLIDFGRRWLAVARTRPPATAEPNTHKN